MQKFTNASSRCRLIDMQDLLRRKKMSARQLADHYNITLPTTYEHIEYLLTFGGIETSTHYGKTRYYHCVTPDIVTFSNERKVSNNAHNVAKKAAKSVPCRDPLTAAFFGRA